MTHDTPPRLRCRQIEDRDIVSVIDLLLHGFPGRQREYWSVGFRRQAARDLPPGAPRYGFILESEARPVGAILLLYTTIMVDGDAVVRCNLSSWYVDPAFRTHASMMVMLAMKSKAVTYSNISPAPHTLATIQTYGFRRYAAGVFVGVPSLRRRVPGSRIHRVVVAATDQPFMALPERDLLLDHAAMGCISLVVEAPDGLYPFVFQVFRIRSGRIKLPMRQLIYCRDMADYIRFAGIIGRYLLWHSGALVVHDANGPEANLIGRFFDGVGPKFFRGPKAPKLGDLAYTERVIFGP